MSRLLSRRAFSAGLVFSVPAAVAGVAVAMQSAGNTHDPAGAGLDLESVFLRMSPYDLRDRLISTPFDREVAGARFEPQRWADVSQSPYFTSVGGVHLVRAGGAEEEVLGAFSVYHAPAGARAGQFLGRQAIQDQTTETLMENVGGYDAEVLVYGDSEERELTHLPVGNVMVIGFDRVADNAEGEHPSLANAGRLLEHLGTVFRGTDVTSAVPGR